MVLLSAFYQSGNLSFSGSFRGSLGISRVCTEPRHRTSGLFSIFSKLLQFMLVLSFQGRNKPSESFWNVKTSLFALSFFFFPITFPETDYFKIGTYKKHLKMIRIEILRDSCPRHGKSLTQMFSGHKTQDHNLFSSRLNFFFLKSVLLFFFG